MAHTESERHGYALLAESEAALARLYALYAELFPDERAFWARLSEDETKHAAWVTDFLAKTETGNIVFKEGRLAIETFTTFLEYLKHRIEETRLVPPTLFQALSIARDIESSLIERHFFEVFEAFTEDAQRVLRALHTDTERHRRNVDAAWERHRPHPKQR